MSDEQNNKQQFYIAKRNFLTVTTLMAIIVLGDVKLDTFVLLGAQGSVGRPSVLMIFLGVIGYYMYRRFLVYRTIVKLMDVKSSVEIELESSKKSIARGLAQKKVEDDEDIMSLYRVQSVEPKVSPTSAYSYNVTIKLVIREDLGENEGLAEKLYVEELQDEDIIPITLDPIEIETLRNKITESYIKAKPNYIDADLPVKYFWVVIILYSIYTICKLVTGLDIVFG